MRRGTHPSNRSACEPARTKMMASLRPCDCPSPAGSASTLVPWPRSRHVEGVVEMVLDATAHCNDPITGESVRLACCLVRHGMFGTRPDRRRRLARRFRRSDAGSLRTVEAPARSFRGAAGKAVGVGNHQLSGLGNTVSNEPPLIKAALAHLRFVTLHRSDDGNGRIARAVGDLFLARAECSPPRFLAQNDEWNLNRRYRACQDFCVRGIA